MGFSHSAAAADNTVGDVRTAADLVAFLSAFVQDLHPRYRRRPVWVTGESYAGHYVPGLADALLRHNEAAPSSARIRLAGIMVGNAWTDTKLDNTGALGRGRDRSGLIGIWERGGEGSPDSAIAAFHMFSISISSSSCCARECPHLAFSPPESQTVPDSRSLVGAVTFWHSHALISDGTKDGIFSTCNMSNVGPLQANPALVVDPCAVAKDPCECYLQTALAEARR